MTRNSSSKADPDVQPASRGSRGGLGGCAIFMVGILMLAAGAIGSGIGWSFSSTARLVDPPVRRVNLSPPVVASIRQLAHLETVQFHMERVVDLREEQKSLFGLVTTEDALLLVAAADVIAGVDLSGIEESDVTISKDRRRVELRLPAPTIFSARLDNERTYVHSRKTGLLAKRSEDLETEARRSAEKELVEAAKKAGILDRASGNAKATMEALLASLGFTDIKVTVATP